jgi:uncharacterized lipoprotein YddW (UPF0748 family)
MIKEEKPHCKFGISPFCVWRNIGKDPEGSETQAGQTNYDDLYADILLWLRKGWIDYVVPQLYLEIGYKHADYSVLLPWWNNHSFRSSVLYRPGHLSGRFQPRLAGQDPADTSAPGASPFPQRTGRRLFQQPVL